MSTLVSGSCPRPIRSATPGVTAARPSATGFSRCVLIRTLHFRFPPPCFLGCPSHMQGSKDGVAFTTLFDHVKDAALQAPGSTATWPIVGSGDGQGFRFFRVRLTGPNSGGNHILSLSGLELYGTVTGVVVEPIAPPVVAEERAQRRQRALSKIMATRLAPGMRVGRGPDWKWSDQNGRPEGLLSTVNFVNSPHFSHLFLFWMPST